jgi:hypothetical protein
VVSRLQDSQSSGFSKVRDLPDEPHIRSPPRSDPRSAPHSSQNSFVQMIPSPFFKE